MAMTRDQLKETLKAWARWKSIGHGYPSQSSFVNLNSPICQKLEFASRIPRGVEIPSDVRLILSVFEYMKKTSIGRLNFSCIFIHYNYSEKSLNERRKALTYWMKDQGILEKNADLISRSKYFDRIVRAEESILDCIERFE